jgi:MFS transporter, PAT family, solute carrier family 33 (acetyl-CoA transportor), member 1
MIVLLMSKFGFQANEAVTNLKLLEKGFGKEDLALTVLIDFPFSILFGYYAAKWSTGPTPLKPWMFAWVGRLLSALINMVLVAMFPKSGVGFVYFVMVILAHVSTSFMRFPLFSGRRADG